MGNNSNNNSGPNQNNQNNSEVQVDGGDLTYHVCKVIPTNSSTSNKTLLIGRRIDNMKFNVNNISSST